MSDENLEVAGEIVKVVVDTVVKAILETSSSPKLRAMSPYSATAGIFAKHLTKKYGKAIIESLKSKSKNEVAEEIYFREARTFVPATTEELIRLKIRMIICDELGVDEAEVTDNARFIEDLNADSLDLVELAMRFEEEFDIEIPDEQAELIQSVRDAYAYIEQSHSQNQLLN